MAAESSPTPPQEPERVLLAVCPACRQAAVDPDPVPHTVANCAALGRMLTYVPESSHVSRSLAVKLAEALDNAGTLILELDAAAFNADGTWRELHQRTLERLRTVHAQTLSPALSQAKDAGLLGETDG